MTTIENQQAQKIGQLLGQLDYTSIELNSLLRVCSDDMELVVKEQLIKTIERINKVLATGYTL